MSAAPEILEPLQRALAENSFTVELVPDGATALGALRSRHRLVIVDDEIGMGQVELCRALRSRSDVPVILITAIDDENTIVGALEAGADDVVVLPAPSRELVARARAAIRRGPEPKPEETAIEIGGVRLDPTGYVVTVAGERVEMTRKEFELLRLLMANAGHIVSRRVLNERVWGWESTEGKTLDTHVRRIRAKIEDDPSHPVRIVTVRKVGYRFNLPRR